MEEDGALMEEGPGTITFLLAWHENKSTEWND